MSYLLSSTNSNLYQNIELYKAFLAYYRWNLSISKYLYSLMYQDPTYHNIKYDYVKATFELVERLSRDYKKPHFGIEDVIVNKNNIKITEEIIISKSFCNLIHFKKLTTKYYKKILIVAPMAGHHATLLRGTVEALLPYYDVYITDWLDAKNVAISKGGFNLDDYIDYIIEFNNHLGPDLNILAVCQPTVPVLASVSLIYQNQVKNYPKSMILMGGPVDVRVNPTKVNEFANKKTIDWFKQNVIFSVPSNYPAQGRLVYPGFLQLAGFIGMNAWRHIDAHTKLFKDIANGDKNAVEIQSKFYDEYLSVMDLPAEFYLQTIEAVFKEHLLANNKFYSRGQLIKPSLINNTALLSIEGEFDDITGIGQTKAALDLCPNIKSTQKEYYLQKGVGHYGIFSGSKFREQIVPVIKRFIDKQYKKD